MHKRRITWKIKKLNKYYCYTNEKKVNIITLQSILNLISKILKTHGSKLKASNHQKIMSQAQPFF